MSNGYWGKILWVDLNQAKLHDEILDEKLCRDYIGGYGLGARIIFSHQKAQVDPLGPENILGFMVGPLSGTQALAASRYVVVGKSPLTGTWGDANSGGDFGPHLKMAGYDGVFFTGISSCPLYLFVDSGKAELKDATHLWGQDTWVTEDVLKKEHGTDCEIATIGQAGENLDLIAAVINNKGRAAARSGLGAVMGSKKLKAIAVKGHLKVPVYDENKVLELKKLYAQQLGGPVGIFRTVGTPGILVPAAESGDAPVKNWGGSAVSDFPEVKQIGGNNLAEFQEKKYGCYGCVVGCGAHMKASNGEYKYAAGVHRPEYETLAMFGTSCLNSNLESIIKANDLCNRYGLDTISTGSTIAFAIECYENGLISKEDTNGLEMTWGNHRSIVAMTEKIAKREGFGNILANGSRKAAEKIGKGSMRYAMQVHGQEIGAHDPRKSYPMAICYQVDAAPGRHTRDSASPHKGLPLAPFDPKSFLGRAPAQKVGMCYFHVIDSSGCCQFVMHTLPGSHVLIEFLNAVTGWGITMEELLKTGERIANIRHAFNLREGINMVNYDTPDRLNGKPPLKTGPLAGITIDEKAIVREFCQVMDWDVVTAKPSKNKLADLGLDDVAAVLYP